MADAYLARVKNQPFFSQPGFGRLEIDRAYIDFAVGDYLYVRAGKQRIARITQAEPIDGAHVLHGIVPGRNQRRYRRQHHHRTG